MKSLRMMVKKNPYNINPVFPAFTIVAECAYAWKHELDHASIAYLESVNQNRLKQLGYDILFTLTTSL